MIKLSEYAKTRKITYRTAWNHFKAGKIPNSFQDENTGTIYINETSDQKRIGNNAALYARVSSQQNRSNLETQLERLNAYSAAKGYTTVAAIKEIGSGVNDGRQKLIKLLKDKKWDVLIVEHKDRLTRFGFSYIKTLLEVDGRTIEVVNEAETEKADLIQDMISVLYSFSARMYSKRKTKRKKIEDLIGKLP